MNDLVPASLPELAERINAAHERTVEAMQSALVHAKDAGQFLLQAKALLSHGRWLPWLKEHCTVSPRSAQAYMRVASRWEELESKCAATAHLTLHDALRVLSDHGEGDDVADTPLVVETKPVADSAIPPIPGDASRVYRFPPDSEAFLARMLDAEDKAAEASNKKGRKKNRDVGKPRISEEEFFALLDEIEERVETLKSKTGFRQLVQDWEVQKRWRMCDRMENAGRWLRHLGADLRHHNKEEAEEPEPEPDQDISPQDRKALAKCIELANEAINCLTKMPTDRPGRKRGFEIVADWIETHSKDVK